MGEAHKFGDSPIPTTAADTNSAAHFDVVDMWKQDRDSTRSASSGKKLEAGATSFAADIAQGNYSDGEVAKKFSEYAKTLVGKDAKTVTNALNTAFRDKGANWHCTGDNADSDQGNVRLYKNQPNYDDKVLVQSKFFKPGENIDADFNPNKAALSKIAGEFAKKNPDHLSATELATEIGKRIDEMKTAGAGPHDATHAFNDALRDSGQALKVSINTKGKVEVEQYHRNAPVAEVDLSRF